MLQMPEVYLPSYGTPIYWMDQPDAQLKAAMHQYIEYAEHPASASATPSSALPPTPEQLEIVIAYLQYFINAPCWVGADDLRERARQMKSLPDVMAWVDYCMNDGLDPL